MFFAEQFAARLDGGQPLSPPIPGNYPSALAVR